MGGDINKYWIAAFQEWNMPIISFRFGKQSAF
jgi:hypothetical protein